MATAPMVKSVEYIELPVFASNLNVYGTLTKGQDRTKCVPFFSVMIDEDTATTDGAVDSTAFRVDFYDNFGTDVVRVSRGANDQNVTATVGVYVVEFGADIAVYYGLDDYGGSMAIGATVNLDYAFSIVNGHAFADATNYINVDDVNWKQWFSSTTSLWTSRQTGGAGNWKFAWFVVVDTTNGDHFNVQHVNATMTGFSQFATATITAVDLAKSFVIGSSTGQQTTFDPKEGTMKFYFNSTTSVNAQRAGGAANRTCEVEWQVVELNDFYGDQATYNDEAQAATTVNTGNIAIGATVSKNAIVWDGGGGPWWPAARITVSSTSRHASARFLLKVDAQGDGVDWERNSNADMGCYISTWVIDWGNASNRRIYIT